METNQKITMPALVALLAVKSGASKEESEKFLENFFTLISETLEKGDSIKIKGLGTFKVVPVENRRSINISDGSDITIPGHNKVVFVPSREIAELVNSPFSMFDSVELFSEKIMEDSEEVLEKIEESHESQETEEDEPQEIQNVSCPEAKPSEVNLESEEQVEIASDDPSDLSSEESSQLSAEEPSQIAPEEPSEILDEEIEAGEEFLEETRQEKRKGGIFRFLMGFACGLAAAIIICLGGYYFFLKDLSKTQPEHPVTSKIDVKTEKQVGIQDISDDTTLVVTSDEETLDRDLPETQPSEIVVYDTIGRQRYLTTMAQDHYGSFNLWPYIYEENKSFLGHPDRIKPGTRVVIPSLKKYGVDPKNPEDIKKAKAKGVSIYNRYK